MPHFRGKGLPLVVSKADSGEITVLTDRRLLALVDRQIVVDLGWEEVASGGPVPEEMARMLCGELSKLELNELSVLDATGHSHLIHLHAGADYLLIWSAVLALAR